MKKNISIACALALMLGTAGCGNEIEEMQQTNEPVTRISASSYFDATSDNGRVFMYTPETIPADSSALIYVRFMIDEQHTSSPEQIETLNGAPVIFEYPPVGTPSHDLSSFRTIISYTNEDAKITYMNKEEGYALVEVRLPDAFERPKVVTGISYWPVYVYDDYKEHLLSPLDDQPHIAFDGRSYLPGWE